MPYTSATAHRARLPLRSLRRLRPGIQINPPCRFTLHEERVVREVHAEEHIGTICDPGPEGAFAAEEVVFQAFLKDGIAEVLGGGC